MTIFQFDFMQRALLGALIVGFCAPAVGVFLVQKRLALIGDGIGHIALTGVAIGFLTSTSPMWTTLATTVVAAVVMELMRRYSKTSGDVALAMMFYGGLAGGVFLTGLVSDRGSVDLHAFLFGSLLTTSEADIWVIGIGGAIVVSIMLALRPWLAAICHDEEHARVSGLPVVFLNLLLMVTTAVVVSVSMRAVGLLLVSALLVVPVVTVQQFTRGFSATMFSAMGLGFVTAGSGVVAAGLLDVPPGSTVVLLGVVAFILTAILTALWRRWQGFLGARTKGVPLQPLDGARASKEPEIPVQEPTSGGSVPADSLEVTPGRSVGPTVSDATGDADDASEMAETGPGSRS
ncbi:metal ABC transporter permease [Natronoglycomyces albus]|uniref:Metal ABC transporter permease n=1 Tax=Natronoglycomyces albus TaxID=2811108 RepID=A0A895XX13_9ACTN|nr:metal ABC transporter permease [Natronoglycomyces albus]